MELRQILNKLNNPHSLLHGVVSTGAVTALTLVEPRKLTTGRRLAHRGTIAGLAAWSMHAGLRPVNEDDFDVIGPIGRAAITTGTAGAVMGVAEVSEGLDARLHDAVRRTGVSHPRLWLAAGGGAFAAAAWWLGRRFDGGSFGIQDVGDFAPTAPNRTLHEVPDNLRAIISTLLEATDEFAAPQLREQLAEASVYHWDGEAPDFDAAQFHVPNHTPRVVPGNYRFPVIGTFTAVEDLPFTIEFFIDDGYLDSVNIERTPDWTPQQEERWEEICAVNPDLDLIPSPDDVELLIETPNGYQPVER
ncbi:hypothetical protein [Corynebacterium sp. J010B-136]|uniref:hypothetical protein n=1 Tax=Corynebacterium sp. J010B-136 TaxID=2099401 RepID=UPI000CF96091|nr:hypothetical protein [Corynebacterium sp. J010B-136]PQM74070.1 hypothetical protein C5Y44_09530 [Corynebacterium sp. J010B-136]